MTQAKDFAIIVPEGGYRQDCNYTRSFTVVTPGDVEEWFHDYMSFFPACAHDGIISIDLSYLHEIGLLSCQKQEDDNSQSLTDSFHVIESWEKITLYNDQYAVWIIPKIIEGTPNTFTLISSIHGDSTHLEVVFSTSGIYNAPRLILKITEHFLEDIEENEKLISFLNY